MIYLVINNDKLYKKITTVNNNNDKKVVTLASSKIRQGSCGVLKSLKSLILILYF